MLKRSIYVFLAGILAGCFIAIGSTVNLSILAAGGDPVGAKIAGALFFGIGLYCVIQFGTWLYTGKIGNVLDNKPKYWLDLLICFLGNIAGTLLLSYLFSLTRNGPALQETAMKLVEAKQSDTWYSILLLSFGCGIMVYIAVKGHQVIPYGAGKIAVVFIDVATFILCGFEHIIANMAYYTFARYFDLVSFGYFALMLVGNSLGAIFLDGMLKLMEYFKNKSSEK